MKRTPLSILAILPLLAGLGCKKDPPPLPPTPSLESAPTATPGPVVLTAGPWKDEVQPPSAEKLVVERAAGELPLDPFAPAWKAAATYEVALAPQQEQAPSLHRATVGRVRVQGLRTDTDVAFRMTWQDASRDESMDVGRFGDAVALELPLHEKSSPQMGSQGAPVQLILWSAVWQNDVNAGFQDVQHRHPGLRTDGYPHATGDRPHPVPAAFERPASHAWFPARAAGNPVARWDRKQPVQEAVAEGPGSLTVQPDRVAEGRGEWRDGLWAVVIRRPLVTQDASDHQFPKSGPSNLAVALWDGSGGNVGGRKHWSTNWVPYELKP